MQNAKKAPSFLWLLIAAYAIVLGALILVQLNQYKQIANLTKQFNITAENSIGKLSLLVDLRKETDSLQANMVHLLLLKNEINHNSLQPFKQKVEESSLIYHLFLKQFNGSGTKKEHYQWLDSLQYAWEQNFSLIEKIMYRFQYANLSAAISLYTQKQHFAYEKMQDIIARLSDEVKTKTTVQKAALSNLVERREQAFEWDGLKILILLAVLGCMVWVSFIKSKKIYFLLAESRKKYKKLLEFSNEIIYKIDEKGNITYANKCFLQTLGYMKEEINELPFKSISSEGYAIIEAQKNNSGNVSQIILPFNNVKLKTKDGHPVFVEGNITLFYQSKRLMGGEAYLNNVTEKVLLTERLKVSEEKYRNVFELSPLPMWIYDAATLFFIQVNEAAVQHYGYAKTEWLQMKISDIIYARDLPGIQKVLQIIEKKNDALNYTLQNLKKNGTITDVELRGIEFNYEGKPARLVTVLDVTERNQMGNRLSKAVLDTQEQERFQISAELHDNVNQILTGAVFTLGLLNKSELDSGQKKAVETAHKYISMANEAIRKISHRLAPPSFNLVDFSDSIQMLLNSMNIDRKYRIEFAYNIEPGIKMKEDAILNIYRILQEQLNNIHKYAEATLIEVSLNVANGRAALYIADNGKGFDIKAPRTGIGLRNIERRAALFSGYCRIQSSPGNGCSVKVLLPV
ncbi:MAG: PAS domain S-box protein [Hydrotalea flava]|nr:PAS domain S-box protein [Hydrotalea flava]